MFLNKYYKYLSFYVNVSGFLNFIKIKTLLDKHPLIFLNEGSSYFTNSENGERVENGLIEFRKMLLKRSNRKALIINDKEVIILIFIPILNSDFILINSILNLI